MRFYCLLGLSFACWFTACQNNNHSETEKPSALKRVEWMIGNWRQISGPDTIVEVWGPINDTTLLGSTVMTRSGDTVYVEHVQLVATQNNFFYIPTVSNQNNKKPVVFKLTHSENNAFVFENQLHDYPQRIVYQKIHLDSIYAFIDGIEDGQYSKMEFPMQRLK